MNFLRCSGNVMPPLMAFRKAPKRIPGGASAWTLVTFVAKEALPCKHLSFGKECCFFAVIDVALYLIHFFDPICCAPLCSLPQGQLSPNWNESTWPTSPCCNPSCLSTGQSSRAGCSVSSIHLNSNGNKDIQRCKCSKHELIKKQKTNWVRSRLPAFETNKMC